MSYILAHTGGFCLSGSLKQALKFMPVA